MITFIWDSKLKDNERFIKFLAKLKDNAVLIGILRILHFVKKL